MKLFIDTTDRSKTIVELNGENTESVRLERESQNNRNQAVLAMIKEVLGKKKVTFHELTAIEVAKGPGSFTGIRVGVAIANTLGFILGIPVNGSNQPVEPVYS